MTRNDVNGKYRNVITLLRDKFNFDEIISCMEVLDNYYILVTKGNMLYDFKIFPDGIVKLQYSQVC